jgi:effector-binding domain-containing protein
MSYESPKYEVEELIERIEIRRYEPYLTAETTVSGSMEGAGNSGFRVLARYIFGHNETDSGKSTKISMTTPVTHEQDGDEFRVRFMMPSSYNTDSLPTPKDADITIHEVGERRLAAIRYSGRWSQSGYEQQLRQLSETVERFGLTTVGEPVWARYDPPWKPWFLRRNEVLLEIDG